jgi:hypothetical protein
MFLNLFPFAKNLATSKGEKRNALTKCNMRGMANACEPIEYFTYQVHNRIEFSLLIKVLLTTSSIIYLIKKYIFTKIRERLKCSIKPSFQKKII